MHYRENSKKFLEFFFFFSSKATEYLCKIQLELVYNGNICNKNSAVELTNDYNIAGNSENHQKCCTIHTKYTLWSAF